MQREDLTGRKINEWEVLRYVGDNKWLCRCSCGREKTVRQYNLVNNITVSCGHLNHSSNDLIGNSFGDITVLSSAGRGRYNCVCKCGATKIVAGGDIRRGKSIKCNHFDDENSNKLIGKIFGKLTTISRKGKLFTCRCECGNIIEVYECQLKDGSRQSCGCIKYDEVKKLIGKKIGYLTVLEFSSDGKFKCRCDCGNITLVTNSNLRNSSTMSCGCKTSQLQMKAKDALYNKDRTDEQLNALSSREDMLRFISNNFANRRPTSFELSDKLNISYGSIRRYIRIYDLYDYIESTEFCSHQEDEIYAYIESLIPNEGIERHNKSILNGKELDIYIPSKKLAIEFNGNYWHRDTVKHTKYHQEKTIECAKQGIRLIHVFEYEYANNKEKVLNVIKHSLIQGEQAIYARNCSVDELNKDEYSEFLEKYHIQGYCQASIKLGLKYNNELIGVMSFGKPRFNKNIQYELIRLAWKSGVRVIGGAEKLFKHFINDYAPESIISYCDISKFTGEVYIKLGFKASKTDITKPNYVWVDTYTNKVLTRYQTQKKELISNGIGEIDKTEDEIMTSLGYVKIHDCGSLRFTWRK